MQIEDAFRDLKSSRFELSLEHSRTYQQERLSVLLLIDALAFVALWLLETPLSKPSAPPLPSDASNADFTL